MGGPADDPRDSKHWCIQFFWQIQHVINKPAEKVDIGTDSFVDFALFIDDLRSRPSYTIDILAASDPFLGPVLHNF